MLKKQSRRSDRRPRTRGRKSRVAALVIVAMVCVILTSLLAQVDLQGTGKRASGEVSIMSLSGPPAKEYIYAGSKLVATVEPTAVNGNDTQFVSMCAKDSYDNNNCVPIGTGSPFGIAGQQYIVNVTMKNTGTSTWTSANGYKLGSQNPANNTTWGTGTNRILLSASVPMVGSVPPNGTVTFEFGAAKPLTPAGTGSFFNFQWQMVQDGPSGVGYFGEKTQNGLVSDATWLPLGAPNSASYDRVGEYRAGAAALWRN